MFFLSLISVYKKGSDSDQSYISDPDSAKSFGRIWICNTDRNVLEVEGMHFLLSKPSQYTVICVRL